MPVAGKIFGDLDFSNSCIPLNHQDMYPGLTEAKKPVLVSLTEASSPS